MDGRVVIDGVEVPLAEAALALSDEGAVRGDGAFESIGVWGGRAFRLDDHLERLARSLAAIALPAPDRALIAREAAALLDGLGEVDAMLRCYVTVAGTRVVALLPQPTRPPPRRLVPQPAPWIRPLGTYGPAGAKTMSYAPNSAATRFARRAGGDDALLVSLEGFVLEGPTFGVLWVDGDTVHSPARELGIVDSVSVRTVLAAAADEGLRVVTGRYRLDDLAGASEFLLTSAVRDAIAVESIGDRRLPAATPVRDVLSKALDAARRDRRPGG